MSKKTLFFDAYCGYSVSAVTENGKITEFHFEKEGGTSIVGNIYKGRVENVLQGMNAAFVNCGLERNCYLSAEDMMPDAGKYDGENTDAPTFPELKAGDEIMVQVVKAPVGKKGAKVTAFPSFVGKYLIYMPRTPFVGVSRKIADAELRKNLAYSARGLKSENEGLVFRTAAPYTRRDRLELELDYMRKLFGKIENAFETSAVGALLYSDWALPLRVMRDTLSYDVEKIVVGNKKLEKLINDLVELTQPAYRRPVIPHDTGRDMLGELGLSQQIYELASPKVALDNGADLVIEKTEALTVIDVNTGKFTGADNLEQTVYYTNILAAREIARQVKLRNIGGIVVVDFIDMNTAAHRAAIVEELERALQKDGAKCSVSPMSKFGLVEFTRKRSGASPLSLMIKPCKYCKTGYTKSPRFAVLGLRAKLLDAYCDGARKIKIDLSFELFDEITGWAELKEDLLARFEGAEIYAVPHKSYCEDKAVFSCGEFALPEKAVRLV